MSAGWTLVVYCGLILLASLAGGWLPMLVRLDHRRMQVAISFVAGVILGIGLLHLLPHGVYELAQGRQHAPIDVAVWWLLLGFLLMFFLERFFQFHHHDVPADDASPLAPGHAAHAAHGHAGHGHAATGHGEHSHAHGAHTHNFSWAGAAIGLTLHSTVDGIALAAGVAADQQNQALTWGAGLGTFLAIVLHKPFDSLTIGTLMAASDWSPAWRHFVNGLYALVIPLGVLLFYLGAEHLGSDQHAFLGRALGFAAGAFLCIATSDLLPELQFHSHDRGKLSLALLAGVGLALAIVLFEGANHRHLHSLTN